MILVTKAFVTVSVVSILLGGCTSFSGLSGSSSFACKAPDGVTCTSMSGVYANHPNGNGPGTKQPDDAPQKQNYREGSENSRHSGFMQTSSGDPIMSPIQIQRIWYAPWKDVNNDMHDESIIYTVKEGGHWLIETNYKKVVETSRTVRSIQNVDKDDPQRKVSQTSQTIGE